MHPEPQKEHRWLQQLVGEWTFEGECVMGPDQLPMKSTGTESVRSLGGLWTIGEGAGDMPGDGGMCRTIMTLGFDSRTGRFVGTFVVSEMTHLWLYDGSLDAAGKVLTLDTEGPSFTGPEMAKYQDIIEIIDADHRILRSQILGAGGKWTQFMSARYQRKK
jgi:hypothetical protein